MRPTTATHDNVFDFQALLHPGTVFEHPKDLGLRCIGDRVLPGTASSGRSKGAGQHRRHLGSPMRSGCRASPSAGREALQTAVH